MRAPSARRPLCSYSLVTHGRSPRMAAGGLLGELALDVHVLGVDDRRGRDLVGGQALAVVERRPLAGREQFGGLAQRRERAVLLELPRIDMLAGEELRLRLVVGGQRGAAPPSAWSPRRPSRPRAGPRRSGCARRAGAGVDVVQERRRVGVELDQVVQRLGAVAHAQRPAELAQAARTSGGRPPAGADPRSRGARAAPGRGRGRRDSARSSAGSAPASGRRSRDRRRRCAGRGAGRPPVTSASRMPSGASER